MHFDWLSAFRLSIKSLWKWSKLLSLSTVTVITGGLDSQSGRFWYTNQVQVSYFCGLCVWHIDELVCTIVSQQKGLVFFFSFNAGLFVLDLMLSLCLCDSSPASLASTQSPEDTWPSIAASVRAEGGLSVCHLSRVRRRRLQQPSDPRVQDDWMGSTFCVNDVDTVLTEKLYSLLKVEHQIPNKIQLTRSNE